MGLELDFHVMMVDWLTSCSKNWCKVELSLPIIKVPISFSAIYENIINV